MTLSSCASLVLLLALTGAASPAYAHGRILDFAQCFLMQLQQSVTLRAGHVAAVASRGPSCLLGLGKVTKVEGLFAVLQEVKEP